MSISPTSSSWSLDSGLENLTSFNYNNIDTMPPPHTDSTGTMEQDSDLSSWCQDTEQYLQELIEKCEKQIDIHKTGKVYNQTLKHGLAVPSIIVSIIMSAITDETDNYIKRSAFLLNSVLQGLSLYYDAGSKMKLHCKSRDEYTKIVEEASQIIAQPVSKRPPCRETISTFSKQFLNTMANAP